MRGIHLTTLPGYLFRPQGLFLLGVALLALHLLWLTTGGLESVRFVEHLGAAQALLCLSAWSFTSEQMLGSETNHRRACALLAFGAAASAIFGWLRLRAGASLSQAVEAYALGTLAGTYQHERASTRAGPVLLLLISMPLDRAVQRMIGNGLQQLLPS